LWLHESFFLELFKSHIREVIDTLFPGVSAHVVVSDLNKSLHEDLESSIRLDGVRRVELAVDLLGGDFTEGRFTIEEGSVPDVEVDVAESQGDQGCNE
jgi:hypothetical protein